MKKLCLLSDFFKLVSCCSETHSVLGFNFALLLFAVVALGEGIIAVTVKIAREEAHD